MTFFPADILTQAENVLALCRARKLRLVTAESCTGGLICGALTEIAGSSDVVIGGFVSYANTAKRDWLDVPHAVLRAEGAVSEAVVRAMAAGALARSGAQVALAVSGVAGPAGGTPDKPVGHVCFGLAIAGGEPRGMTRQFGAIGRAQVRLETVRFGLSLLADAAAGA